MWDPGERFIDQGEPLLDSNDNGVWDQGEFFVDLNGNGVWDPPNGIHDSNTTIWTETRILYSGRPTPGNSLFNPSRFAGTCASGTALAHMAVVPLDVYFSDLNLNVPQAAGTSFSLGTPQPTKGVLTAPMAGMTVLDGYGFQMDRMLVDASSQRACDPATSTICNWKLLFGGWSQGFVGSATITGAATTDTNPCLDAVFPLKVTVLQVDTTINAVGGIQ